MAYHSRDKLSEFGNVGVGGVGVSSRTSTHPIITKIDTHIINIPEIRAIYTLDLQLLVKYSHNVNISSKRVCCKYE